MGNCCASNRRIENDDLNDDLNTIKPGDARLNLEGAGQSLDLDEALAAGEHEHGPSCNHGPAAHEQKQPPNMSEKQKKRYEEEMAKRDIRVAKQKAEFDIFVARELDPTGDHQDKDKGIIIDFEHFLKVVTAIFFWKKYRFEYDGEKYKETRRMFLGKNEMQMYKKLYITAVQEEQKLLEFTTQEVAGMRLGFEQQMFTGSIQHYAQQSPENNARLQEIFQMGRIKYSELKINFGLSEDENADRIMIPQLSKDQALKLFKFKLDLSLNLLRDIHELAKTQGMEKAKEAEYFGAPIMNDQFFLQSKMENYQFDMAMNVLKEKEKIDESEEYKSLYTAYKAQVEQIQGPHVHGPGCNHGPQETAAESETKKEEEVETTADVKREVAGEDKMKESGLF